MVGQVWPAAACKSRLVLEPAVYGLHVSEDALPVRLAHRNHVIHVQQRVDAGLLAADNTVLVSNYYSFMLLATIALNFTERSTILCFAAILWLS